MEDRIAPKSKIKVDQESYCFKWNRRYCFKWNRHFLMVHNSEILIFRDMITRMWYYY
jgi:hypothetical protein